MPPAVFATPPTPLPRVEVTNVTGLLSFVEGIVVGAVIDVVCLEGLWFLAFVGWDFGSWYFDCKGFDFCRQLMEMV